MQGSTRSTWVCCAAVLSIGVMLLAAGCKKGSTKQAEAPPLVEVTAVIQRDVPIYSEWTASTDGFVNATIRAQVQGYLTKQDYREGDLVKKGQVLFRDRSPDLPGSPGAGQGAALPGAGAMGKRQGQSRAHQAPRGRKGGEPERPG